MIDSLNSPVIEVENLKTKFDTVVVSNSLIALLDYNYNEARFLQQLHYWSYSKYGVVIDGIRWIYKSAREWLSEALIGLTEWKLRIAIASLVEKNLIRKEKLYVKHHEQEYQAPWWNPKNQTYYYSVNYEELQKLIKKAESTGNVRFVESTELSVEVSKETKVCELSQNRSKITNKRIPTTKQSQSQAVNSESEPFAAAGLKKPFKEGKESHHSSNPHSERLTAPNSQKRQESGVKQSNIGGEKNIARVDCIVNKNYKDLLPLLDGAGVPRNKTIEDLLKLYPSEKVEDAIAILKERKRDQYIPNPSGYFVAALKGDWGSVNVVDNSESEEIDQGALFRHWYDLARQLGYCSGQKVRAGEQWICLSGSWERWDSAVKRDYSLDYLKKIIKRNHRQ